ncbi:MAG: DNA repair protein RecO [Anaerolineae bacterium]|jgi:DNA repair protein RecO (recombination protein O)|nr:DNA repair protein RecO [Anaerolineae bacterium]MBT3713225.1 DNA repair protein RecO [Anaerolineae bacterium]MBT4312536.1 DNA repair protein RecO [Anaerolineae bacterium]MBT4457659.1 DNA repair protein RecO [Anaerolineae bacterium]MBT4841154.1 DNA repair protein RecO [Anaerolineae bacterium]
MNSPRSFNVEAIVLRHRNWREADRLITLYTRQRGKIRAVAKGARKIRSRKAGHVQPFTRISIQVARTRGPYIITQVETLDAYPPLREDLKLTGNASYLVELLDRFTYDEEERNTALFNLLENSLSRLSHGDDVWTVIRYYEMRLLDYVGFRPQLFHCANCESEIKAENQFFSAAQGGVLCPQCGVGQNSARPVDVEMLKYLRHFQRSSYDDARQANPKPKTRANIESLMQFYLTCVLERGLNSPQFLKEVGMK